MPPVAHSRCGRDVPAQPPYSKEDVMSVELLLIIFAVLILFHDVIVFVILAPVILLLELILQARRK